LLPRGLRRRLGGVILGVPVSAWDAIGGAVPGRPLAHLGDKAHKLATRLARVDDVDDLYRMLVTVWPADAGLALGARRVREVLDDVGFAARLERPADRMMFWDTLTYLGDDILHKVDRASMGVSLETRAPFLDHRVVELAWRLPLDMKIRDGRGKWILRQLLDKHVPRALIERPKMGFGIPVGAWLRGPLRDWVEALLAEERLKADGYFDPVPIRQKWAEHLSGTRNWHNELWCVLMFQAWLEKAR
jgi:asparagine synthase (glutamine-hydrolysing)